MHDFEAHCFYSLYCQFSWRWIYFISHFKNSPFSLAFRDPRHSLFPVSLIPALFVISSLLCSRLSLVLPVGMKLRGADSADGPQNPFLLLPLV